MIHDRRDRREHSRAIEDVEDCEVGMPARAGHVHEPAASDSVRDRASRSRDRLSVRADDLVMQRRDARGEDRTEAR
ncbi:hypothetical protein Ssi02_57670 [Sinosporangium siamense]|uniref:Uncharacterized protein n=1 Tax=Sinosporangium siamense TaxID=1367973 RepID=A0A919V9P5_9ACTN|nr:hypothetical protein Ssi02_57670 [Sinosporangium siamense]